MPALAWSPPRRHILTFSSLVAVANISGLQRLTSLSQAEAKKIVGGLESSAANALAMTPGQPESRRVSS